MKEQGLEDKLGETEIDVRLSVCVCVCVCPTDFYVTAVKLKHLHISGCIRAQATE